MKSPLTGRPLRNPGHSLDQEIVDRVMDRVMQPMMIAYVFVVIACLEWGRWFFKSSPHPLIWTGIAVLAVSYFAWTFIREKRHLARLRLGRDGERAVGQFLESLRKSGAHVLHDFPGLNFNIDHIVIHGTGVYAIETKTFSKPDRGEARVIFDGERVLVNGHEPDRNPITQSRAAANWLSNVIRESTGRVFAARPVVLFPGWFVETTSAAKGGNALVLEPKQLPAILRTAERQIAEADVNLIAYHLSRYVRTTDATKAT